MVEQINTKFNRHFYNRPQRLMLFDLSVGGHHPDYLQYLIQYWKKQNFSAYLDIVVLPKFIKQHDNVVKLTTQANAGIKFIPISESEESSLVDRSNIINRKYLAFQKWNLMLKYAKQLKATQVLLMYFDIYQLPILAADTLPCPVSGIYFRSRFHYGEFNRQPLSWREKLNLWREKIHLARVLKHPQLNKLFCLDMFVVKHLQQWQNSIEAISLPDPVVTHTDNVIDSTQVRKRLGIAENQLVFLLFGALDERKGLHKILDAIALLPKSLSQKVCLLLAGRVSSKDRQRAYDKCQQLTESLETHIIIEDRFLDESEIQTYFQVADVILAPYQRHVGMSGILVRAAAAGKPVLASDYGLMGEVTRRYQLGLAVDSTVPQEIADGINYFIERSPCKVGNLPEMGAYAKQNSADKFARVIFDNLLT